MHTKGEWTIEPTGDNSGDKMIIAHPNPDDFRVICTIGRFFVSRNTEETKANACLIAAAPDLLGACKCALADLEGIMPKFEPSGDREHPAWKTIHELEEAIAKAESEQKSAT